MLNHFAMEACRRHFKETVFPPLIEQHGWIDAGEKTRDEEFLIQSVTAWRCVPGTVCFGLSDANLEMCFCAIARAWSELYEAHYFTDGQ